MTARTKENFRLWVPPIISIATVLTLLFGWIFTEGYSYSQNKKLIEKHETEINNLKEYNRKCIIKSINDSVRNRNEHYELARGINELLKKNKLEPIDIKIFER